jgi:hypothetical protein
VNHIIKRLREVQRVSTSIDGAAMAGVAADMIEAMQDEIRELRKDVCWLESLRTRNSVLEPGRTPEEIAEEREWDCFKETR